MAKIAFDNVGHTYSKQSQESEWALKPISMTWDAGKVYALVGPSGCGKTTILNIISGIITPYQGSILFDDQNVTKFPISERNVAQVFQFPTIYKSMTVFENLAFPLVCRKLSAEKIKERVGDIAEQIGISHKLDRSANKLGADEKQLISLGRGLVRDDVTALLMDEPLTVIDPQLKFNLRKKIKQIIQGKNITVVYVTHDQYEAMTFADELLVMSLGSVVQSGTPEELFEKPSTKYVGNFIGSPAMNFIRVRVSGSLAQVDGQSLKCASSLAAYEGQEIEVGIRPEHMEIVSAPGANVFTAYVVGTDDFGSVRVVNCDIDGQIVKVKVARGLKTPESGKIHLRAPQGSVLGYFQGAIIS